MTKNVKQLQIGDNDSNQRLDKFLKKFLPGASISHIYKLNRKGNIKINKKKKPNDYSLVVGDEIKIFMTDDDFLELTKKQKTKSENKKTIFQKSSIVYEDKNLLVVNKDSGIIVHPGDFKSKESSLIEQVQDYLSGDSWGLTFQPSLVHRIDKETSGIVLIAKQKQLLTQLVSDFKTHSNITKTYSVLVLGRLSRKTGTIKKKLHRIENAKGENKIQISDSGQTAITHYKLSHEYQFNTGKEVVIVSQLEVIIETGRMHQIRVHLASIGNPVIGDKKYGDHGLNSYCKKHFGIERQLLHAYKIEIFNSLEKKQMKFTAPLKKDMNEFTKKLEKNL